MIIFFVFIITFFLYSYFLKKESPQQLFLYRADILKAIFPFVIIVHHISFKATDMPLMDFRYIGPYIVGIFFCLSGYGLEYKYQSGTLKFGDLGRRLKGILLPLLLPLLLYSALTLPFQPNVLYHIYTTVKDVNFYLPYTWFVVILAILYTGYYVLRTLVTNAVLFVCSMFIFLTILMGVLYKMNVAGTCYVSNYAFLFGILLNIWERKYLLDGVKIC